MEDNRILKLIYMFFVGLLLALFVGVGINTFYPGPKAPEYPTVLNTIAKEPTSDQIALQREFDVKMTQHNKDMQGYNRNVSIITLIAAVIFLALSLAFEKSISILANGVLLGGLFTLLYSIGRGFASENSRYLFVVITVSLLIVLYLGFHRFVRKEHITAPKSKTH